MVVRKNSRRTVFSLQIPLLKVVGRSSDSDLIDHHLYFLRNNISTLHNMSIKAVREKRKSACSYAIILLERIRNTNITPPSQALQDTDPNACANVQGEKEPNRGV